MSQQLLLTGQVLRFVADPFEVPPEQAVRWDEAIVIENGRIMAIGAIDALSGPNQHRVDYGQHVICAGFVDAHVHYPQTAIIASWGKRLIDWLNTYTFPEESRFSDPAYAALISNRYLDLAIAHGTTTMASFCTSHAVSVDAFFEAAGARNMCVVTGKTCMDRNAPHAVLDTAQTAYDDSLALLTRWHGTGRAHYAITPRFSPTSTPEQLQALGALWAAHPSCLMQTHLSEQVDEVAWVQQLFPKARDYLDTYEQFGLLGARGIYGHAIHLQPREVDQLAEHTAAIAHCPTSNSFIGSGLCDVTGLKTRGIPVGLATDTGGGSSFSMLRTMAACYEVGQLRGAVLHAAQLMYLATQGAARALHLQDQIGNIALEHMADLVILDMASTPAIAQRNAHANSLWEQLFTTIMMGDDRAIADTYIAGKRVAPNAFDSTQP
ncbi:MAG: guanine deaminase [Paracoccaceae bacterium]